MKDLIYLAKSKGFTEDLGFEDVDDLLTQSQKWEYIWLHLLKRWLEETFEMYITINLFGIDGKEFYYDVDKYMGKELGFQNLSQGFNEEEYFKTPTDCLKSAVEFTLNQIEC